MYCVEKSSGKHVFVLKISRIRVEEEINLITFKKISLKNTSGFDKWGEKLKGFVL